MINHYLTRKIVGRIKQRIVYCLVLMFTFQFASKAQDIHFTQFDFNPVFLNPANTGNFIGDWRVAGNFRNQWAGSTNPFNTATVSADMPVYILGQKLGAGILVGTDISGPGKLNYNLALLSLGYGQEFSNNYFYGGLQVGYLFASVNDWNNWNHLDGDFTAPSGEQNFTGSANNLDVNIGLGWKRNINIFEPEAGFSIQHLNSPTMSFVNGEDKIKQQINFYALSKVKFNDEIYLIPKFYYAGIGGNSMLVFGTEGGYKLLGNKSSVKRVFGGIYMRHTLSNSDAFALQAGTTVGRLDVAVSYDIGVSDLSQSKNMGSFEISLIYKSISTVLNSYSIPCERY